MAQVHLDTESEHPQLRVQLSVFERLAGLLSDQTIQLCDIAAIDAIEKPSRALSGWRAPGFSVPLGARIGTWRQHGRKHFVCVRPNVPALQIEVHSGPFDSYLISTDGAGLLAARVGSAVPSLPARW